MDKNKLNPKKDKNLFYIMYAIIFAYVIFNIPTVYSWLINILRLATPFYIAIVIAFILNIPMRNIENFYRKLSKDSKKMKLSKDALRALSVASTLAIIFFIVFLFSTFIIPRIGQSILMIFSNLDNYAVRFSAWVTDLSHSLKINYTLTTKDVKDFYNSINLNTLLQTLGNIFGTSEHSGDISYFVNSIGGTAITVITSFFMAIYILSNKEKHTTQFRKILVYLINEDHAVRVLQVCDEANHYFNSFITGAVTEAAVFMTLIYIIMRLFSLPFPELIAICGFMFSFIPMFGSFLTLLIGTILVSAAASSKLLLFVILFISVQQFEGNFIYPRIVGSKVGIGGLFVLLGITIFGKLFGFVGVLIGVPLTALIYALLTRIINFHLYQKHLHVTSERITRIDDDGNDIETLY